jgi:hypothetical protein
MDPGSQRTLDIVAAIGLGIGAQFSVWQAPSSRPPQFGKYSGVSTAWVS